MHRALSEIVRLNIGNTRFDAPLRGYSRWRIGGSADLLVEPENLHQIQILRQALSRFSIPHIIIGDGSNLLFDDKGIRGVAVKIGRAFARFSVAGKYIDAQAGVFVPRLVRAVGGKCLSGLEHAIGIPGTLGGLISMNGGSNQKCIGDHVISVRAIAPDGTIVEFDRAACQFGYRSSIFQNINLFIVDARLSCTAGNARTIRQDMLMIMRSRREKFPLKQPNCGSVFLSDPKMFTTIGPPGKLIEACGLKGLHIGNAMIPFIHANFIVNLGNASSSDVLKIIRTVQETVYSRTGYMLQCEVRYVLPNCQVVPGHVV